MCSRQVHHVNLVITVAVVVINQLTGAFEITMVGKLDY